MEKERLEEPVRGEGTQGTVFSGYSRTATQRLWQHAQHLHGSKPGGVLARKWGSGHDILSLTAVV